MTSFLSAPIRWPAETLWETVAPSLPGFTVEILPEIDSTSTELMRRVKGRPGVAPQPEPLLLVAEQQNAGRGRLGRLWQSRCGDSLTFSLGLPLQPQDWSGLSLAIGISLAESLEPLATGQRRTTAPRIGLKWPNDLWLSTPQGERKLAGILVETANGSGGMRHVVIGVGINIRPVPLPAASATDTTQAPRAVPPGGLQELHPDIDAAQALLRVVPALVQTVLAFEQFGFAPFQARFAVRDVLAGRAVQLSDGTQGTAYGVSDTGALLVQTAAGMVPVSSAEVSVRPVASAKDTGSC